MLPPATAQALTARPSAGVALSVLIAVVVAWLGIGVAYYSPYPIGFWVTTIAFAAFVLARTSVAVRGRLARGART